MPNEPDMSAPVTRGEMHTALETWAGAIIDKLIAQSDAKFAGVDAKFAEVDAKFAGVDAKFAAIDAKFDALEARIFGPHETSLVSEMRALWMTYERNVLDRMETLMEPHRSVPARVSALEQQALPERVSKLEVKVFAPKRRAKAVRRTRS